MKMDGLGVSYESKERNIVLICNENNVNRWSVVLIDKWSGVEGGRGVDGGMGARRGGGKRRPSPPPGKFKK